MYQLCIVFILTLTRTFFRWPCPVWFLEWPDWISHSDLIAGLECLHWQVLRWLAQTADSFSRVFLSPCKEKKRDPTWQFWKRVQFFISPLVLFSFFMVPTSRSVQSYLRSSPAACSALNFIYLTRLRSRLLCKKPFGLIGLHFDRFSSISPKGKQFKSAFG